MAGGHHGGAGTGGGQAWGGVHPGSAQDTAWQQVRAGPRPATPKPSAPPLGKEETSL